MSQQPPNRSARWAGVALALVAAVALTGAQAQTALMGAPAGRIDFAAANLPPATVEIDLERGIFSDLFGLSDAAILGVIETLTQSERAADSEVTKMAAEKLASVRKVVATVKDVVQEVRVRIYEDFDEGQVAGLAQRFQPQLEAAQWNNIFKVRDGEEAVHVSIQRKDGELLGLFVVANDGNEVVLVNVVCNVSPEKVKKLTSELTKIGIDNGLLEVLEHKLRHLQPR